ncbi:alpha/beta hydrolase [Actinoplanes sp. NPDC049265]|uniref:alpha/beta hydrolase n=1 Tax=Actinoplanes sp. NPDC049265 TaxID=3363902 RepID=UPI00371C48A7
MAPLTMRIITKPSAPEVAATRRRRRWTLAVAVPLAVLLLAVATIYLWPLGDGRLRRSEAPTLGFADATAAAQRQVARDETDATVRPECRTQLLTHGQRASRTVLMLHGYTGCPADFQALARVFFDRGYNVYVPREPRHGRVDKDAHEFVTATELVDYADTSAGIAAGLGSEFGVVGLSGGGNLATWLTEYRGDVKRALLLAPFYAPDASQAPPMLIKPMTVLWGRRVLPDRRNGDMFYSALAQYLQIRANYKDHPVNESLTSLAVVTSGADHLINVDEAFALPGEIARTNDVPLTEYKIPAAQNLPHDIVGPASIGPAAADLYPRYLTMYEAV